MTASVREALHPWGAKDNPRCRPLDLLWQHRGKLRRLSLDHEVTLRVQNLVEGRQSC
jgi:hypothetical protein